MAQPDQLIFALLGVLSIMQKISARPAFLSRGVQARAFLPVAIAACALGGALLSAPSAHAQANTTVTTPTGWGGASNDANTATGAVAIGAAHNFGTALAQSNVGVDYGAMANTTLARFMPVLALAAIFGTVIIAAKGGVKMLQGALRRNIK